MGYIKRNADGWSIPKGKKNTPSVRMFYDAYDPKYQRVFRYRSHGHDQTAYLGNKKYIVTRREKCVVCKWVGFWYHFDHIQLPHYCWNCANDLIKLWRGKHWDDKEDIPF